MQSDIRFVPNSRGRSAAGAGMPRGDRSEVNNDGILVVVFVFGKGRNAQQQDQRKRFRGHLCGGSVQIIPGIGRRVVPFCPVLGSVFPD